MEWNEKLRLLRAKEKWSLAHVADQIGISRPTAERHENGGTITLELMEKYCELYKVDGGTLFFDKTDRLK